MKLFLANYALGRMFLHLGCILRGGKLQFHLAGVRREVGKLTQVGWLRKRAKGTR